MLGELLCRHAARCARTNDDGVVNFLRFQFRFSLEDSLMRPDLGLLTLDCQ